MAPLELSFSVLVSPFQLWPASQSSSAADSCTLTERVREGPEGREKERGRREGREWGKSYSHKGTRCWNSLLL